MTENLYRSIGFARMYDGLSPMADYIAQEMLSALETCDVEPDADALVSYITSFTHAMMCVLLSADAPPQLQEYVVMEVTAKAHEDIDAWRRGDVKRDFFSTLRESKMLSLCEAQVAENRGTLRDCSSHEQGEKIARIVQPWFHRQSPLVGLPASTQNMDTLCARTTIARLSGRAHADDWRLVAGLREMWSDDSVVDAVQNGVKFLMIDALGNFEKAHTINIKP